MKKTLCDHPKPQTTSGWSNQGFGYPIMTDYGWAKIKESLRRHIEAKKGKRVIW